MTDGAPDIEGAAAELAQRVPDALAPLARAAFNYRWSWHPDGPAVFEAVDPARWERAARNPVRLLQETTSRALNAAAADASLVQRAEQLERDIEAELERPPADVGIDPEHPIAFFCAEYAIHGSLPALLGRPRRAGRRPAEGGIGPRACRSSRSGSSTARATSASASTRSGWQHEYWIDTDPERLPAALVTNGEGEPLTIEVPLGEREIRGLQSGGSTSAACRSTCSTPNRPDNDATIDRWITAACTSATRRRGSRSTSCSAWAGCARCAPSDIEPGTLHLNEGHAALAPIELRGRGRGRRAARSKKALASARARTVFTTHTPVPAGNESYPAEQVEPALINLADDRRWRPRRSRASAARTRRTRRRRSASPSSPCA